jgi:hypothetical protein
MSAASGAQQTTAIGNSAAGFATGNFNTAVGSSAGFALLTGAINTIIGTNAGRGSTPLTTGSYNVLIGAGANTSSANASNEIVVGFGTGAGDNTAKIYASAGLYVSDLTNGILKAVSGRITNTSVTTTDLAEGSNLYYTTARAQSAITAGTGISVVAGVVTNTAPAVITSVTGTTNQIVVTGTTALTLSTPQDIAITSSPQFASLNISSIGTNNIIYSDGVNLLGSANGNCILGALSGDSITSGGQNIALGFTTMSGASSPLTNANGHNVAIGTGSLNILQGAAQYNLAIGAYSGQNLTTSNYNIFYGYQAGKSVSTSSSNIAIGNSAIGLGGTKLTTTDGQNIAIGNAASYTLNGSAQNNITLGYNAMYNATSPSDNIILGTNAGNAISTSSGNIAIGGSSLSTGFTPLVSGNGRNIAMGIASGLYLAGNSQYNIMIGEYAGFNNSLSSSNIYLGRYTQGSSSTVANEIVISTKGDSSAPISGLGANTAFIDARAGLYYWNPATAYLTGYAFSSGRVQWQNTHSNNPIFGFTLGNVNGYGANTTIIPGQMGIYEITVSGTILGGGGSLFMTLNNINIANYNTFLQSLSSSGYAYQVGFTSMNRPYTNLSLAGFEVNITGGTYYSGLPLCCSIKFIGI